MGGWAKQAAPSGTLSSSKPAWLAGGSGSGGVGGGGGAAASNGVKQVWQNLCDAGPAEDDACLVILHIFVPLT
jgi:hypothetical protein